MCEDDVREYASEDRRPYARATSEGMRGMRVCEYAGEEHRPNARATSEGMRVC